MTTTAQFIFNDLSGYLEQLLSKSVYYFFLSVYEKAKATDAHKKFRHFQEKIRNIPEWPDSLLEKYCRVLVKNNADEIQDVLVRLDRIYNTIYMPDFTEYDSMEMIRSKTFIHNVLKQAARDFFANPFVFDIDDQDALNFYLINNTLKNSIQCALRETLMPRLKEAAQIMRRAHAEEETPEHALYRAHEYNNNVNNVYFEPDAEYADAGQVYKVEPQEDQRDHENQEDQGDQGDQEDQEDQDDQEDQEDHEDQEDKEEDQEDQEDKEDDQEDKEKEK